MSDRLSLFSLQIKAMLVTLVNTVLIFITRPYIYAQKHMLLAVQSYVPMHFDEQSWYVLFGLLMLLTLSIAYILSRCVTLKDADDDPVYQRAKLYSMQRQHRKRN
jgi:hypothetical protein